MNWWQCPRCGTRLLWKKDTIDCPNDRCTFVGRNPAPVTPKPPPADF